MGRLDLSRTEGGRDKVGEEVLWLIKATWDLSQSSCGLCVRPVLHMLAFVD